MVQLLEDVRAPVSGKFFSPYKNSRYWLLLQLVQSFIDVRGPTLQLSGPSLMVARWSVFTAGGPLLAGMLTFPRSTTPRLPFVFCWQNWVTQPALRRETEKTGIGVS